jgi:hypothetical protein
MFNFLTERMKEKLKTKPAGQNEKYIYKHIHIMNFEL